jgi:hypothetical protein
MGRWKVHENGQRQLMATVKLDHRAAKWGLKRERGAEPYESSDADTLRIWWNDVGVHQNLTFPVHPDPISGMHCWHQAVRVRKAEAGIDNYGDIHVSTRRSRARFTRSGWPDATRRKVFPTASAGLTGCCGPLKPAREFYKLPIDAGRAARSPASSTHAMAGLIFRKCLKDGPAKSATMSLQTTKTFARFMRTAD